ncbi:4'-phosphopantetheinyl transferase family protein [Lysobacter solisilvae (ex Woo and Kim 2022)]|uniref:4'-phosphopantetheinyl transferase superfamily protein n=1 Tax=Agrilutibacter terrestris TaxID=2865112 RepID=A0A7H0FU01_9GAMM|nr:4'-phosphopantetheinyl transferase superfamily protein [Lysobacter terrestris]QNP39517.1 4'-phosphopantetheinyl transferase superfamily protein [Lysobacter terrestris]
MAFSAAETANPIHGPVRWSWHAHAHGTPTDPIAKAWLAAALAVPADALNLQREPRGRPRLGPPQQAYDCSWSHSGDGLLIALGHRVELGVDCERMRPRPRALELARRYFTAPEQDWLAAFAPGEARDRAFLRLWCAKEAVLKAHGHGLSFGLEKLRFADTGAALTLVECAPGLGLATDWSLHEFAPAPDYVAALAWRDPPPR